MNGFQIAHWLKTRLWLVPLLCLVGGILLSVATIAVDRATNYTFVPQTVSGTATDVQTILCTAATSLVSLTSVVLSLTLVAVQLAMGQFSPRIVGSILQ